MSKQSSDTTKFTVRTGASENGDNFLIEGIPSEIWAEFQQKTADALPEHGDNAWSVYLCNAITALCEGDTSTFILTDIPVEASDKLKEAAKIIHATPEQMVANLFATAMTARFHAIRFTPPETAEQQNEMGHTIMLFNLPEHLWKAWDDAAVNVGLSAPMLLGQMFEAAAGGTFALTRTDLPPTDGQEETNASTEPTGAGE